MEISFYLKDQKANKTRVICRLTDGRDYSIRLSTGISVDPKHWLISKKVSTKDSLSVQYNAKLDWLKTEVTKTYNGILKENRRPDRNDFLKILTPEVIEPKRTFWDYWEQYKESKKSKMQIDSFKKFKSIEVHLKNFESQYVRKLQLDQINFAIIQDLHDYFLAECNLNNNTAGRNVKFFKQFLNWCCDREYTTISTFKSYSVKSSPDTLKVVLSQDDLRQIRKLKLEGKQYLANVRDLLLLACWTGLRFSDFSQLNESHYKTFNGQPVLKRRQEKTEDFVEIPLIPEADEIMKKIIDGTVRAISLQKMNTYVKELGKVAGINEPFEKHDYRRNEKVTKVVPKYELITTHTGRRTFATNLLLQGVSPEVVMEFTGHRDYKSFSKYVNIPSKTKQQIARDALMKMNEL